MLQRAFDLIFPNYDPQPPRENVMRMAHDVVKYRRRAYALESWAKTILDVMSDAAISESLRVEAAQKMLTCALSDAEKIE